MLFQTALELAWDHFSISTLYAETETSPLFATGHTIEMNVHPSPCVI